jgi:hypothetical protein
MNDESSDGKDEEEGLGGVERKPPKISEKGSGFFGSAARADSKLKF